MTSAGTDYRIARSREVTGEEIADLRRATGDEADLPATWDACVRQSLCVVTARTEGSDELIGVGFVVGNARHAELVDISVSPGWQRRGVGREIGGQMVGFALEQGIKFVGLTWDKSKPWLADAYRSAGFREIDFAMWHESSVQRVAG